MTPTPELIERPAAVPEAAPAASRHASPFSIAPAVDIVEDAQGVTLWADLPGVAKADLDLRVHEGRLTIDARAAQPHPEGLRVQHAEWHAPRYLRSFSVGPHFDTARVDANLRDGVLTLRIPRRAEALSRRIEVATGTA